MTGGFPVKRTLTKAVPVAWRAKYRRLFREEGFHLYPPQIFSRHRPQRETLGAWIKYEIGFHWWHWTRGRGATLKRPILMIGCPRSGTWVSLENFVLHPEVTTLSEAIEIWDPRNYRDPAGDHHWEAERVRPEDAARLHARFEYHRQRTGKPRFINKHPRSSVRIDYIRKVFPDAVFIHVIRDGRAVAASLAGIVGGVGRRRVVPMPMCHPPNWRALLREDKVEQAALQWREIVKYVLSRRAALGPAYHAFKYEELCQDPRGVLAAAYRFAGLRVDEEILGRLPERLESRNYKWKQQLTPEEIERVNRLQEPLLSELGYTL